jgi:hypothetical protein
MPSPQSGASVFVLATRLFVHYKFKTRKAFDPSATLVDDAYAREVLSQVRAIPDARLKQLADAFELARFGKVTAAPAPGAAAGVLDLSFDTPG